MVWSYTNMNKLIPYFRLVEWPSTITGTWKYCQGLYCHSDSLCGVRAGHVGFRRLNLRRSNSSKWNSGRTCRVRANATHSDADARRLNWYQHCQIEFVFTHTMNSNRRRTFEMNDVLRRGCLEEFCLSCCAYLIQTFQRYTDYRYFSQLKNTYYKLRDIDWLRHVRCLRLWRS